MTMKRNPRAALAALLPMTLVLAGLTFSGSSPAAAADAKATSSDLTDAQAQEIITNVRKQIVRLTQYGVFDHLWFGMTGRTIVLRGFASRPILKSAAESAVKGINGVEKVKNEIEVLPLSSNDDRIRASVYQRLYSNPALSKYTSNRGLSRFVSPTRAALGITNDPPLGYHAIRIIVKNGEVTLYGVVDNSFDFTVAEVQAKAAPLTFGVFNELTVDKEEK
jgi:hyperosmotically inducible periplasmic protein